MSAFTQIIAARMYGYRSRAELEKKIPCPSHKLWSKYPIGLTGVHLIATVSIACSDIDAVMSLGEKD